MRAISQDDVPDMSGAIDCQNYSKRDEHFLKEMTRVLFSRTMELGDRVLSSFSFARHCVSFDMKLMEAHIWGVADYRKIVKPFETALVLEKKFSW